MIRPTRAALEHELNRVGGPWPDDWECPTCGDTCTGQISDWLDNHPAPDPWFPDERAAVPPSPATASASLAGGAAARKAAPMADGLLGYFPNACAYVSYVSKVGNDQHNPGLPMQWDYPKSSDHANCIVRHQTEAGTPDTDGLLHSGKVAWRALAQLERELLEADPTLKPGRRVVNFSRGAK